MVEVVGIVAGVLTATSLLPQLVKIIRERKATDISPLMLVILLLGLACWIVYGIMIQDWPIMLTNSFSLFTNLVIIFLRIYFK